MSETKDKGARRAARAAKGGSSTTSAHSRGFTVASHGDGLVMVDTSNGRSWMLADAGGTPTWQPVGFGGNAERAPRGHAKDDSET